MSKVKGYDNTELKLKVLDKWRKIILGIGIDEGVDNCAYCEVYFYNPYEDNDDLCMSECPVIIAGGFDKCQNTPYIQWRHLTIITRSNYAEYVLMPQAATQNRPEILIPVQRARGCNPNMTQILNKSQLEAAIAEYVFLDTGVYRMPEEYSLYL